MVSTVKVSTSRITHSVAGTVNKEKLTSHAEKLLASKRVC